MSLCPYPASQRLLVSPAAWERQGAVNSFHQGTQAGAGAVSSSSLQILRCFTTAKGYPGAHCSPSRGVFSTDCSPSRHIFSSFPAPSPAFISEDGVLLRTGSFCCFRFAGKKTTAGTRFGNQSPKNHGKSLEITANPIASARNPPSPSPGAERNPTKSGWTLKNS